MVEAIFKPVILRMAHGAIGGITLGLMVQGNIIFGLMATYTVQGCSSDIPFVALRALND
jgi:hypothetical protein